MDQARIEIVEDVYAEMFAHLDGVPGLEVHCDPDISWKLGAGAAWSNCGVRLRLSPKNAGARLDEILARYGRNGRGAGFWVSPSAQPDTLDLLLKKRALHCRKYFPAMYCDLEKPLPDVEARVPLQFAPVADYKVFRRQPHPSIGRITTAIRRFELAGQEHLDALAAEVVGVYGDFGRRACRYLHAIFWPACSTSASSRQFGTRA